MRYMIIETFEPAEAPAIYQRLGERGRSLPEGLAYLDSWVSAEMDRCFQLMECDDKSLIDGWTRSWEDLATFEVVQLISSAKASQVATGTSPRNSESSGRNSYGSIPHC